MTGYTQIAEERVSSTPQKTYLYGPQRISMRDGAGLHYYGYDAHSGVRLLVNSGGAVTDTWEYDAFGSVIARTGGAANEFTYRGEQTDSTVALQYLRSRWMDPGRGRFWTRDTWEGTVGEPLGQAAYAYSSQNPLDCNDPSGHKSTLAIGLAAHVAIGPDWASRGVDRIPNVRTITNLCGWRDSAKIRRLAQARYGRSNLR